MDGFLSLKNVVFSFPLLLSHTWMNEISRVESIFIVYVYFLAFLQNTSELHWLLWKITCSTKPLKVLLWTIFASLNFIFKLNIFLESNNESQNSKKGVPHVLLFTHKMGQIVCENQGYWEIIAITWLWVIHWLYLHIIYSGHGSTDSPPGLRETDVFIEKTAFILWSSSLTTKMDQIGNCCSTACWD